MKRPMFFYEGDAGGASGGDGGGAAGGGTLLSGVSGDAGAGSSQQTGTAVVTNEFTWANPDGALNEGWLGKLPVELQNNPSLKSIGTLPDLAKSYVATKALIGTKLEAPGENATPEQIANWRKTVGAPEKPEGYYGESKTLRPGVVPEGMWDEGSEKQFLEIAHKHHLPPAAVKEILDFYGQNIANSLQGSQAAEAEVLKNETATLRKEWGGEFDSNLALASRTARTVGLDPKTDALFTSARAVQAFAQMGKLISEDKLVKGDTQGVSGSFAGRIADITDPKSQSVLARDYRGDNGPERQAQAQKQFHQLLEAQETQK